MSLFLIDGFFEGDGGEAREEEKRLIQKNREDDWLGNYLKIGHWKKEKNTNPLPN